MHGVAQFVGRGGCWGGGTLEELGQRAVVGWPSHSSGAEGAQRAVLRTVLLLRRGEGRLRLPGPRLQRFGSGRASRVARSQVAQHPRQLAEEEVMHAPFVAEAHLLLARMHVDIDEFGVEVEMQREDGVATVEHHVAIRLPHGVAGQSIPHRAAVDEEELAVGAAVGMRGQADAAPQPEARHFLVDGHGMLGETVAEHAFHSLWERFRARIVLHGSPRLRQAKADAGVGQRRAPDGFGDVQRLGAFRLQELAPRRGVEEELADFHRGTGGMRCRAEALFLRAVDFDAPGGAFVRALGDDAEHGHGGGAGEGLAAKAEGGDAFEIVGALDLAGGVAGDGQAQLVLGDAAAVVAHRDALHAAAFDFDFHRTGTGVDAVLDQLLDDGGRALDHFASGDLVGHCVRQPPNAGGRGGGGFGVQPPAAVRGMRRSWPM